VHVCVCGGGVEFLILKQAVYTGAVIYASNIVFYITSYEINAMKYRPIAYTTLLINFWPRRRHITYLHNVHALLHCLFCILFLYYDSKPRAVSAALWLWYILLYHWCNSVTALFDRTSQGTQLLLHCSFSLSTHLAGNTVTRALTRSHPGTFVLVRQ